MKYIYKRYLIAADHAGFELKKKVMEQFADLPWEDLGTHSEDSVDYPDYAGQLVDNIRDEETCGVLICGSGQGMAIRANRAPYIRAALCWTEEIARLSRTHNDANVLCLAAKHTDADLCLRITEIFMTTAFEGGRHARRVEKLRC